jgi:hypothetical protein
LDKDELPADVDEAAIFFAMLNLSSDSMHATSLDDIDEFEDWLTSDRYYVANNLVARKGKTVIFKGRVVLAELSNLVSFLRAAIADKDLRPLLISPIFEEKPKQVIFISEEECHLYVAGAL